MVTSKEGNDLNHNAGNFFDIKVIDFKAKVNQMVNISKSRDNLLHVTLFYIIFQSCFNLSQSSALIEKRPPVAGDWSDW